MGEPAQGIGYRLLVESEQKAGCRILKTGDVPWLQAADWRGEPVITLRGLEVRIVAVWASEQGKGTFKRLVRAIQDAGLKPVVVAPFHHMQAILERWGWKATVVSGDDEWRPPA